MKYLTLFNYWRKYYFSFSIIIIIIIIVIIVITIIVPINMPLIMLCYQDQFMTMIGPGKSLIFGGPISFSIS
jgi:hypothetical protein